MGRYLLSGLLFLAFGALNALAAENQRRPGLALARFATRNRAVMQIWSGLQFRGVWEGRSMRERHGTRTGRTDNTATRSIKFKRREQKRAPAEADALNLGPSTRTHGSATTNKGCLWRWRDALASCSR